MWHIHVIAYAFISIIGAVAYGSNAATCRLDGVPHPANSDTPQGGRKTNLHAKNIEPQF